MLNEKAVSFITGKSTTSGYVTSQEYGSQTYYEEHPCIICHGDGRCHICNGTGGTYNSYKMLKRNLYEKISLQHFIAIVKTN